MAVDDLLLSSGVEEADRALTRSLILDEIGWPNASRLVLVQWLTRAGETRAGGHRDCRFGHVQRDRWGVPEPVVYLRAGPGENPSGRILRYANLPTIVDAGWRFWAEVPVRT
jgi:hypothetical protein